MMDTKLQKELPKSEIKELESPEQDPKIKQLKATRKIQGALRGYSQRKENRVRQSFDQSSEEQHSLMVSKNRKEEVFERAVEPFQEPSHWMSWLCIVPCLTHCVTNLRQSHTDGFPQENTPFLRSADVPHLVQEAPGIQPEEQKTFEVQDMDATFEASMPTLRHRNSDQNSYTDYEQLD